MLCSTAPSPSSPFSTPCLFPDPHEDLPAVDICYSAGDQVTNSCKSTCSETLLRSFSTLMLPKHVTQVPSRNSAFNQHFPPMGFEDLQVPKLPGFPSMQLLLKSPQRPFSSGLYPSLPLQSSSAQRMKLFIYKATPPGNKSIAAWRLTAFGNIGPK